MAIERTTTVLTVKFLGKMHDESESRLRNMLAEEGAIEINGENVCEGCSHCEIPGVRWPASPNGNSERSWVERCDSCERYESDLDAAIAVALKKESQVGLAIPDQDFVVVSPTGRYGRTKLTEAYYHGPADTTPFVDREERDS